MAGKTLEAKHCRKKTGGKRLEGTHGKGGHGREALQPFNTTLLLTLPNPSRLMYQCIYIMMSKGGMTVQHSYTATLQHCNTSTLQHSNTAALQYCSTPILQHSNTATLQHCSTSILQHSNIATLQYCNTSTLHTYCTQGDRTSHKFQTLQIWRVKE